MLLAENLCNRLYTIYTNILRRTLYAAIISVSGFIALRLQIPGENTNIHY